MNRISSTAVTVALAATLLVATAPVAQARNLAKPQPAASVAAGGLLDAALSWLGSFFVTTPQRQTARSTEKATTLYPIALPPLRPLNGSCIDPNGCTLGGGI
jgi:hypothetical protein